MKKFYKVAIIMAICVMTFVSITAVGIKVGEWMAYKEDMHQYIEVTGEEMDDEMKKVYEMYGINVCLVLHDIREDAEANRARYKYEFTLNNNEQIYMTCQIEGQREPIIYEIVRSAD